MTIQRIQEHGLQFRNESGDPAKIVWQHEESRRRFLTLPWVLEARRMNLRAAHRRWLRRNGKSF